MTTTATPLQPIPRDFRDTVAFALGQYGAVRDFAAGAVAAGVSGVFLVGCGGALADACPAHFLLEAGAPFPVRCLTSAEFTHRRPATLGKGSVVLVSSHTGTTKESLAAARLARAAGARVAAVTRAGDSPLAGMSDAVWTYRSDETVVAPRQVLLGQFAHAFLEAAGAEGDADRAAVRAAYEALPDALYATLEETEELNHALATALADEPVTYVLASGPQYGEAYAFAMCHLLEKQWKHAAAFHAGEFFHGAFEIVTAEQAVLLFLGEDATRPLAERARAFLDRHTKKAHYIDTAELRLPGVPAAARGAIGPLALATVTTRFSQHLEAVRGHGPDKRRYMFRIDY
ncbi:SIS domain-containing protein [Streptomyces albireticuli]|uniref:SIS domain-containing protein n=1 Tax=Streptomyces albireticuli TaxID=1940 RepID=UPI00367E4D31